MLFPFHLIKAIRKLAFLYPVHVPYVFVPIVTLSHIDAFLITLLAMSYMDAEKMIYKGNTDIPSQTVPLKVIVNTPLFAVTVAVC